VTFATYVYRRLPALVRTATAVCGDQHLAEELVQDVLVKLHRHWAAVSEMDNLDAYARRMLVNETISWRRKWARQVPTSEVGSDGRSPDHAEQVTDRQVLRTEVAKLPHRQRVALALRYFDGLADADIAAAMNCAESSVRSYISRGLAGLRIELADFIATGGTR